MKGMSSGPQWQHWSKRFRGEVPRGDADQLEIWGYVGQPSYAPGDEITVHVSTTASSFDLLIYREGAQPEPIFRRTGIPGKAHETPGDAYATGCGWPSAAVVPVSADWRSGGYVIELTARSGDQEATQDGFFVVRPPTASSGGEVALVLATYTWQAYNDWGGGSAYSQDQHRGRDELATGSDADLIAAQRSAEGFSPRLSFDRPWARGLIRLPVGAPRASLDAPPPMQWAPRWEGAEWAFANGFSVWSGMAGWASYESHFVRWAEENGYTIDLLTQWDLDHDPECLSGYKCVVTVGHDEYWTAAGRGVLDDYVERGGHYARLAGNILWRIRLEDSGRTFVCYKYAAESDPLSGSEDQSGAFESASISDPPVTTFGANGARGIYSRLAAASPRGLGGFIVYRNDHWVFDGCDLYYADVVGADVPLVAYECDGVAYTFRDGYPLPTGEDGAPIGLEILALTPATLEEEDHGHPGGFIMFGDGDLSFAADALFGSDTPEHRAKIRHGAAVMTWMKKGAGEVFCGGTTEWPYALSCREPVVEKIVRNVLDRFTVAGS
jgi:hypothetical protein